MVLGVYSVYDRVSGEFGVLSLHKDKALACRQFQYVMSQSPMVSSDCDLYYLGEYDTLTGVINTFEKPAFVCRYEVK